MKRFQSPHTELVSKTHFEDFYGDSQEWLEEIKIQQRIRNSKKNNYLNNLIQQSSSKGYSNNWFYNWWKKND